MIKANLVPCYILHSHKYKETSLLLDVFSKEFGRIGLIAKGANRNKKQQGIAFNPYQKYLISWVSKSELGTLTEIELVEPMTLLKEYKSLSGFYLNEITIRLLHKHEPHPELFDSYDLTIKKLINDEPEESVLRYFEKTLLQSIGYGLVLDVDVRTGEPIIESKDYYYELDFGPSQETVQSRDACKVSGKTLLDLDNECLVSVKEISEAKLLLRKVLSKYLGNKPLASRELYSAYIKNKNII